MSLPAVPPAGTLRREVLGTPPAPLTRDMVLVVDADGPARKRVCDRMAIEGLDAVPAADALHGLRLFRQRTPALLLVNLATVPPEPLNGLDLCRLARADSSIPILTQAEEQEHADRVDGLRCGADECLPTPCSTGQILIRVRTHLREARTTASRHPTDPVTVGPISLFLKAHEVSVHGRHVPMTRKEFQLLESLMTRPGRLVTRSTLLSEVWNTDYRSDDRTLDVHVRRVRSKVEEDPRRPRHVITIRGLGYKLLP